MTEWEAAEWKRSAAFVYHGGSFGGSMLEAAKRHPAAGAASGYHVAMLFYDYAYPGDREKCPCDFDFADWLELNGRAGDVVFHLGTGTHHTVGQRAAPLDISVLGITASRGECDAYEDLVIREPRLSLTYKVQFADVYALDVRQLPPAFNAVSLFHLCEFTDERRAAYGATDDLGLCLQLVDRLAPSLQLADRLVPGGAILFYTRSAGYGRAEPVIAEMLERRPALVLDGVFKSLVVYRNS